MSGLFPVCAAQFNLPEAILGFFAAIGLVFAVITLTASRFRFQTVVDDAKNLNIEKAPLFSLREVLRVHLSLFLSRAARQGTSFCLAQIFIPGCKARSSEGRAISALLKEHLRADDVVCPYENDCTMILFQSDPEEHATVLERLITHIVKHTPRLREAAIRAGVSSYPGHGLSGSDLIKVAGQGLEECSTENPIIMPTVRMDEQEDREAMQQEEPPKRSTRYTRKMRHHKESMLDERTGVLKASTLSTYLQRMMNNMRLKKKPCALFCIGMNNVEHIARLHGPAAADEVLAGISSVLQRRLRAEDMIGRHEKYAFLVLATCSLEQAGPIAHRISTQVRQTAFLVGRSPLRTTVMVGISAYPQHGRNLKELYAKGQQVLDYNRENDIRSFTVYDPKIHAVQQARPLKSIKSISP